MKFIYFIILTCGFFLAGCSGLPLPDLSGTDVPVTTGPAGSGYPAPSEVPPPDDAYPAPGGSDLAFNYATPGPVPTPKPGSGGVVGLILVNEKPVPDLMIYLAEVMVDDEGQERVASYDRSNSPRAYTNGEGQFVFSNIQPGRYGLILDTVLSSFLLFEPDGENPLLIEVKAGELVELGEINYDELPIPENP